jgi:hypothetical protein
LKICYSRHTPRTDKWLHISEEDHDRNVNRIGNLALLKAGDNANIGSEGWDVKKPVLQAAAFQLTKEAARGNSWGIPEIEARQKRLAQLAVKVWPLKSK